MPCGVGAPLKFLSTLSLRRATVFVCVICQRLAISIHALLAESDQLRFLHNLFAVLFLSTLSLRRATTILDIRALCLAFLSTLSLRRATTVALPVSLYVTISIHALLAESDPPALLLSNWASYFYPRSPCGERRRCAWLHLSPINFYPRSPCGERQFVARLYMYRSNISIHALLAESDKVVVNKSHKPHGFLSTLSLRRATLALPVQRRISSNFYPRSPCGERLWHCLCNAVFLPISIHALLAESDYYQHTKKWKYGHFYPRSPCGERLMPSCKAISLSRFLSTLSLRRATLTYKSGYASDSISIHALLAESDYRPGPFQLSRTEFLSTLSLRRATRSAPEQLRTVRVFLSTLSLRRATARGRDRAPAAAISIHALLAESDNNGVLLLFGQPISIHALLAESDRFLQRRPTGYAEFLSTLSLRRATLMLPQPSSTVFNFYPRSPCGERPEGRRPEKGPL